MKIVNCFERVSHSDLEKISVCSTDAARMIGVSIATLDRLVRNNEIKFWRINGRTGYRFFDVQELREFVKQRIASREAQDAVPSDAKHLLPELARENGHQCRRTPVQKKCGRGCRRCGEDDRQDQDVDPGVSTRCKKT